MPRIGPPAQYLHRHILLGLAPLQYILRIIGEPNLSKFVPI